MLTKTLDYIYSISTPRNLINVFVWPRIVYNLVDSVFTDIFEDPTEARLQVIEQIIVTYTDLIFKHHTSSAPSTAITNVTLNAAKQQQDAQRKQQIDELALSLIKLENSYITKEDYLYRCAVIKDKYPPIYNFFLIESKRQARYTAAQITATTLSILNQPQNILKILEQERDHYENMAALLVDTESIFETTGILDEIKEIESYANKHHMLDGAATIMACARVALLKLYLARERGITATYYGLTDIQFYTTVLCLFSKMLLDVPFNSYSFNILLHKSMGRSNPRTNLYNKFEMLFLQDLGLVADLSHNVDSFDEELSLQEKFELGIRLTGKQLAILQEADNATPNTNATNRFKPQNRTTDLLGLSDLFNQLKNAKYLPKRRNTPVTTPTASTSSAPAYSPRTLILRNLKDTGNELPAMTTPILQPQNSSFNPNRSPRI